MTTLREPSAQPDRSGAPAAAVTSSSDEQRASIRVVGDLDGILSSWLRQVIDAHVSEGRRFLRIDLSGVTDIGETALQLLVDTHLRVLAQRGTLVLIGAGEAISHALRSTDRADELFLLEPFVSDPLDY